MLPEQSETSIQKEILFNGVVDANWIAPVGHSIFQEGSIVSTKTHTVTANLPNHAAAIIGWGGGGDEKYWLVQNAYGEGNGDKGIMKVARGSNEF